MSNIKRITQTSAAALCAMLIAANGVPVYAEETPSAPPDTVTEQTADATADPAAETETSVQEETPDTSPDASADPVQETSEDAADEPSADPEPETDPVESDSSDISDVQSETEAQASVPTESEEISVEAARPAGQIICNGQISDIVFDGDLGNEDSASILGDSWFYGITADTFTFNGESETNFAVKNFEHASAGSGQTGVTDKGAGSERAWFVVGSIDAPFMVKGLGADITVPKGSNDLFTNSTNGSDLKFNNLSQDVIDEYVDDLRSDAATESTRLAGLDSIRDYSTLPQNQMTIDVTSTGTDTVYLNADAWEGLKNMLTQSSGITIRKNPEQKVIINYPSSTDVTTQKIVIDQDGVKYDTTALANQSTKNLTVAEDIILNMPAAANVTLNDTTGIILAPNAEVHCYGVDGGWITCEHMINECEWHFINGHLPSQMVLGEKRLVPKHYGPTQEVTPSQPEQPQEDTPSEPDTPEIVPDQPENDTPAEPETPEVKPDEPQQETPSEPENPEIKPSEPEKPDVPDKPEVTPSEPEKPSRPEEKPDVPKHEETVPDQPTHVEPEITPPEDKPSDKPSEVIPPEKDQPEETPSAIIPPTEDTPKEPKAPEVTPDETEKPSVPENPEETPSVIPDTPKETEEKPSESEETSEVKPSESVKDTETEIPGKTEDTPSVPVTPDAPSVPETPQPQPEITTAVVQPVTPSITNNEDEPGVLGESRRSRSPQTGDNSHIALYGASLIGSLLILALWFFFHKKYTES